MDSGKRGDGRVDAGQFHRHHAVEQERPSQTTKSVVGQPGQPELAESGDDLEREAAPLPVLIYRRLHFGLHEVANAV
jgi:hypothetical protein